MIFKLIKADTTQKVAELSIEKEPKNLYQGDDFHLLPILKTNYVDKSISWNISDKSSANTYIDNENILHIGEDEQTYNLTITLKHKASGKQYVIGVSIKHK